MPLIGSELKWDINLSKLARMYCAVTGVPIVGLRVRWRRLVPLLPKRASVILDAGCGRGVISRAIAQRYPDALSRLSIPKARSRVAIKYR